MNLKILLAFLGGAALASGIVYMAVRPGQPPAPTPVVSTPVPKPAPAAAMPSPQPAVPEPQPFPPAKPSPVKAREAEPKPAPPKEAAPPPVQVAVNRPAPEPPPPDPTTPSAPPPVDAAPAPAPHVELPPPPQPHSVTIPVGALIDVRLGEAISAKTNVVGDTFLATLEQPLVVDGFVIAERGARAEGRVVEAEAGGRAKGGSRLGIELTRLHTSDGQHVKIATATLLKQVSPSYGKDAAKVGAGAAIGAIIGAIAGGGKGAGIGAGVGGAAGAGDVLLTRGKPAAIPAETRVSFRVQNAVTITERVQ